MHLLPEIRRQCIETLVLDEIAELGPDPGSPYYSPAAFVARLARYRSQLLVANTLRLVSKAWNSDVAEICDKASRSFASLHWPNDDTAGFAAAMCLTLHQPLDNASVELAMKAAPNTRWLWVTQQYNKPLTQLFTLASTYCPKITSIITEDRPNCSADTLLVALERWCNAGHGGIRHLVLPKWQFEADDQWTRRFFKACPSLHEHYGEFMFHFFQFRLSDEYWDEMIGAGHFNLLREFDWSAVTPQAGATKRETWGDELVRRMMVFAREPKRQLEILKIGWCDECDNLNTAGLTRDSLTALIQACPRLKELTIFGENMEVPDDVYTGLGATLRARCPNLKNLKISAVEQSPYWLPPMGEFGFSALSSLPCLEYIVLNIWPDMKANHLIELCHVPTSIARRMITVANWESPCRASVVYEFVKALAAHLAPDGPGANTPGGGLELILVWDVDDEEFAINWDDAEQLIETIHQFRGPDGRRFTCNMEPGEQDFELRSEMP
ncbi:hypothetical protein HDU88_003984 [Geranomyces variabilis]|nr:hypothetical protein HDU88_003984 [Geranomyces variabilis]